jgi:hypothetical protein
MPELADKLEEARAEVARLERLAATATCIEIGHDWKYLGGANCGCHEWACCSVPVHECARCKACDYGDNKYARDHISRCDLKVTEQWEDVEEGFDAGEWNNAPAVTNGDRQ